MPTQLRLLLEGLLIQPDSQQRGAFSFREQLGTGQLVIRLLPPAPSSESDFKEQPLQTGEL